MMLVVAVDFHRIEFLASLNAMAASGVVPHAFVLVEH